MAHSRARSESAGRGIEVGRLHYGARLWRTHAGALARCVSVCVVRISVDTAGGGHCTSVGEHTAPALGLAQIATCCCAMGMAGGTRDLSDQLVEGLGAVAVVHAPQQPQGVLHRRAILQGGTASVTLLSCRLDKRIAALGAWPRVLQRINYDARGQPVQLAIQDHGVPGRDDAGRVMRCGTWRVRSGYEWW